MSSVGCLIKSNADIAGVGVRIAVYVQNILCFSPALWAIADGTITKYELDSMENMSLTNLVVAFGILISCFVQTPTLGLTNFHASIVLSMSWMNNTNVFIYFLLYAARLRNRDGSWVMHLKDHVVSALHLRHFSPSPAPPRDEEGFGNRGKEQVTPVTTVPASPGKIRLFRRVALVLGSLHLTLMSTLGIWLWSDPRGFGTADSACAVDRAGLAIAGARVPFGSQALRAFSLFIYGLFLVPGVNLLLPATVFIAIYLVHGKFYPGAQLADLHEPQPQQDTPQSTAKYVWSVAKRISSPKSSVFPAFVGICFLLAVNIIFIVDIELTLRNNQGIQEPGEAEWGFGQVLAVLLLFLPLRDLVEMIFRRRQELQTQMDNALKTAINAEDFEGISRWVAAGANPATKGDRDETALQAACTQAHWNVVHVLVKNGVTLDRVFTDGRTAFEVAVSARDWDGVRILLELGADINAPFKDGRTALEVATYAKDWEGVRAMVGLGADINTVFKNGWATLEVATHAKDWERVAFLVELGASVNARFKDGRTALEVATHAKDWEGVRALVGLGADINTAFKDGRTAFEAVTHANNWERVAFLVELGASVNARFKDGQTALEVATYAKNWEGVRALVGLGADINSVFKDGRTPLEAASFAGDSECVHILVELGADINTVNKDGQTALAVAAQASRWKDVRILIELGANVNVPLRNGFTVLKFAAEKQQWGLLLEIIDAGADSDVNMPVNNNCDTVLHLACESECQPAVIEQLLQRGADPNAKREYGWTALHRACDKGREGFVPLLLAYGADPHLQTELGNTSLHHACFSGHGKCAERLLKHQEDPVDLNAKNNDGWTPLHLAYVCGRQGCVGLLLENGADEAVQNRWGRTPGSYARR